jgi:hypothetical protein
MSDFSVDLSKHLKPDAFLQLLSRAATEQEGTKYRILAVKNACKEKIDERKLYPYIGDANITARVLKDVLNKVEHLEYTTPVIQDVDWENEQLHIAEETQVEPGNHLDLRIEAIEWALADILKPVLREGKEAFQTIEEQLDVMQIAPNAPYLQEGFMLISLPGRWELHRYLFSDIASSLHEFGLKTVPCQQQEVSRTHHPTEKTQLDLSNHMKPIPQGNPAVFSYFFPQWYDPNATAVPVAKRYLLDQLQHNL